MYVVFSLSLQENDVLRNADLDVWENIFVRLRDTLRQAGRLCVRRGMLDEEELEKYFVSGTVRTSRMVYAELLQIASQITIQLLIWYMLRVVSYPLTPRWK